MRLPFNLNDSQFADEARIKFTYTAPELNQNIEISIDGSKLSVDVLLETFERFMSALGVSIPEDVVLGFIRMEESDEDDQDDDEDDEDGDDDDGDSGISFTLDDDPKDSGKGRKKK